MEKKIVVKTTQDRHRKLLVSRKMRDKKLSPCLLESHNRAKESFPRFFIFREMEADMKESLWKKVFTS
jgi:hypothetical protein